MGAIAFVLGIALLCVVAWDVFETIVVPRPTPGSIRIGRYVTRLTWRLVSGSVGARLSPRRDRLLGLFAPAIALVFLMAWLLAAIVGYGLVLYAFRDELRPATLDLGTILYFSASSVLTLGYGDIVAVGPIARFVVASAAVTGLGMVALVITFLFSLYGNYQRREVQVVLLQSKAGVPPSAVVLFETMARLDLVDRFPEFFSSWSRWAAEVLDSHVAYPLLGFFRSSHDNLSWISALGTALDAASLVTSTIKGVRRGEAELMKEIGSHLVEDITNLGFASGVHDGIDRHAFDKVYKRLLRAGYELEPENVAWPAFSASRAAYASRLEAMAAYWAVPATSWFGENEPLRSPTHRPELGEAAPEE